MSDKIIQQLADKFGTTVEHLWAVMVRQARVEAVLDIFWILALIATLVLTAWFVRYAWRKTKEEDYSNRWDEEAVVVISVVCGIISALITVPIIALLSYGLVSKLFNPEYWALQQILDAIK